MTNTPSKLALGSANFGLDYGVANNTGKISESSLSDILFFAQEACIEVLDTAQAYGDSESRIGSICDDAQFKFVTKIGAEVANRSFDQNVTSSVKQSCRRLNQSRLYAVMLHRPEVLLGNQGREVVKELQILKEQGIVSKVGVSIYSPEILTAILGIFKLDIIQVPFNLFDQQILSSGWSDRLKSNGVEIHTRSVFLQGLLLMQRSSLPEYFMKYWPAHFEAWYKFLNDNKADALEVALKFALKQDWIDKIVVGVDNVSHLKELIKIEKSSEQIDFPLLACDDANLIDPSKWKLI
jgi:aryl-alcohol dehydrogenase-like predicted oxidoreductase